MREKQTKVQLFYLQNVSICSLCEEKVSIAPSDNSLLSIMIDH